MKLNNSSGNDDWKISSGDWIDTGSTYIGPVYPTISQALSCSATDLYFLHLNEGSLATKWAVSEIFAGAIPSFTFELLFTQPRVLIASGC